MVSTTRPTSPTSVLSSRPLTSSLSGNSERNHLASTTSSLHLSPKALKTGHDENRRPTSPLGETLEEMLRASQGTLMEKLENLEGPGDILVLEGLVPEKDITEIDIVFDDTPLEVALRTTTSTIPVDVVEDDVYHNDLTVSFTQPAVKSGKCGTTSGAAEASSGICENRLAVKGPETLRERRMSYLRAMHAMSNQHEARPPFPILPTSVSGVPEWKIEAGVLRARRPYPSWTIPEFRVKYGGTPKAHLRAQRGALAAEVQRRRTDRLLGSTEQPVPVPVLSQSRYQTVVPHEGERDFDLQHLREVDQRQEEASRAKERERQEIEEYLRSADIDAGDLDERSMRDVVDAVLSAAAEVTRLDV